MATYYYVREGIERGPVDEAEVRALLHRGELSPADTLRRSGSDEQSTVDTILGHHSIITPERIAAPGPEKAAAFARMLLPWLTAAGREALLVMRATAAQILRLIAFVRGAWQARQLARRLRQAKAVLGRKLAELGMGDPALSAHVRQLEDTTLSIRAAGGSTRRIEQERTALCIRLAESVLGASIPASVSQEFAEVIHTQSALLLLNEQQALARRELLPPPGPERRRVAIGASACLLGLAFVCYPLL